MRYLFLILATTLMLGCATRPAVAEMGRKFYEIPPYSASYDISLGAYNKASAYFAANYYKLVNKSEFVVIDFSRHASLPRMVYFDLKNHSFTTYHVAAGKGSDPDGDGYATLFSNRRMSKMSALGAYRALDSYEGKHGYSMRLKGLDATNDNAEVRAIVVHGADYVSEAEEHAGRSWGCPAMDPSVVRGFIDRVKNGTILFVTN